VSFESFFEESNKQAWGYIKNYWFHMAPTNHHLQFQHKDISTMAISIGNMSSSERNRLAESIEAAAAVMSVDERRKLIAKLGEVLADDIKAQAEDKRKKTVISKLNAARSDQHLGGRNELGLIDGSLRRAGVEPLDSLAVKPPHEIHQILASATKMAPRDRFAVKSFLFKIGSIPA
jgi:hypothetical protein